LTSAQIWASVYPKNVLAYPPASGRFTYKALLRILLRRRESHVYNFEESAI